MRRVVVLALAVALLVPTPAGVAAHGNDLEVDAQISADGTVLVENVLLVVDGFLVLHRDADGAPGEVIGHAAPPNGSYTTLDIRVPIDDEVWAEWGDDRPVWVAIHRDEGREGFHPGEDPIERSFGSPTADRVRVGKGDRETSVVAAGFTVQRTARDAVTVRRVAMGMEGLVAVSPETTGGDGPVVGATPLDAGVHKNVTVPVEGSVFASRGRRLSLVATLYRGNGTTVAGSEPVRVGGEPIRTEFAVERTGPLDADGTRTGGSTATPRVTTRPLVVTATDTATPAPAPTGTETSATGAGGPGPGVPAAAGTVLGTVGALVLARRRR